MNSRDQEIPSPDVDDLCELMKMAFENGEKWFKSIDPSDWRSQRYRSTPPRRFETQRSGFIYPKAGRPPVKLIKAPDVIKAMVAQGDANSSVGDWNFLVRPDPLSEKHGQRWICILRIVPHRNIDQIRHINFNAWFHGLNGADMRSDLLFGWRFEGSEGDDTSHNLYHMQPIRGFIRGEESEGCISWMPESFPTVPVAAKNQIHLAFVVLFTLGGKEGLRKLLQDAKRESLRKVAREFWGSIFSNDSLETKPEKKTA